MGMYLKQQQRNSRLHDRLTHQLDVHLTQQKPLQTATVSAEKPIVSLRWALFMVFTSGGCVAILLALVQRQNPSVIDISLHARTLALLGLASIILGCATLLLGRNSHGKPHHV